MGPMMASIWLVVLSFCVNGAHGMIGGASMDFGRRPPHFSRLLTACST
jgi:hypothetical protein